MKRAFRQAFVSLCSALLFLSAATLAAQIRLEDPGFPRRERISYMRTSEGEREMVDVELTRMEEADRPHLLYSSTSDSREVEVKLDLESLTVYYSEILEKNAESTVHQTHEVVENTKEAGPGELLITGANGFETSLRGFPWERHDEASMVFLNDSNSFSLKMKVKGKETIELHGRSYECRKVQVSLDGFMGRFFPKSRYWYSIEPPHILVRSESAGMGGGGEYEMELRSYSAEE